MHSSQEREKCAHTIRVKKIGRGENCTAYDLPTHFLLAYDSNFTCAFGWARQTTKNLSRRLGGELRVAGWVDIHNGRG